MKTPDLQQASSKVAKSFLATMRKHVRFNWKLSLGNVINLGQFDDWFCILAHGSCLLSVWICDKLQIYVTPQWLILSSYSPCVRLIISMRLENSFGVSIRFCYKINL